MKGRKKMNKKNGFSLVELIIVIAVMMVIASSAVPQFAYIQRNAEVKVDIRTAESIGRAVRMWLDGTDPGTAKTRLNELNEKKVYGELTGIDDFVETTHKPKVFSDANFYPSLNSNNKIEVRIAQETTKETTDKYTITTCYEAGIAYIEK